MHWYIGMEIVCIKTHPAGIIKEGDNFVIKGLTKFHCHDYIDIDVGIKSHTYNACFCGIPINKSDIWWFKEMRFAPKQYLTESESAVKELLKEMEVKI